MTTLAIGDRRAFMITVRRIDLMKDDTYKIACDIPEFESNYEVPLTHVPSVDAERLTMNETYSVLLEKGRLKEGKDPQSMQAWAFWWEWKGFQRPGEAITPSQQIEAASTARAAAEVIRSAPAVDPTRQSIERQVALKESNLVAQWLLGLDTERSALRYDAEVARLYPLFCNMLHNGAPDNEESQI